MKYCDETKQFVLNNGKRFKIGAERPSEISIQFLPNTGQSLTNPLYFDRFTLAERQEIAYECMLKMARWANQI